MVALLPALFLLLNAAAETEIQSLIRKFTEVFAAIERSAADPVKPDVAIYEGAIPAMLRRLDPHSVFLDRNQFEQLQQLQESRSKGFGSVVSVLPGRVIVLQTLPGTPSARAGLEPGDEILAVNGIPLHLLDMQQLIALLGQSRQAVAHLDVRRQGHDRTLQFVLTPEEMQSPSVERVFFLRPDVGYIRVASFDFETGEEVRRAIEQLGGHQLKGLVLDLRNNPGGLLGAALHIASLFLEPGKSLLTVRGRAVEATEQKVPEEIETYRFPLAVLINERSASASEIVAGSLQDHRRAVITGAPSFGKGLVETVYPLSDGAGLALTTAFYYTPSGRNIQRPLPGTQLETVISKDGGGIVPDLIVHQEELSRLQLVLDASGAFTSFATEYIRGHSPISESFEVTPAVLDELQAWLAERNIQPGVGEWSRDRHWIQNRLKAEIFNQALGVAKGDEVEAQRDPQIQAALKAL